MRDRSSSTTRYRSRDDYSRRYSGRYYGGGYGSYYGSRFYYTSGFYRPHYHYCNDFSVGIVIGLTPIYGYRYWDPYCGIAFGSLGSYYDHCCSYGHPEAILVMDRSIGAPVATCVYDDGSWVVDDCGNRSDDQYDDEYYDDDYED